MADGQTGSKWLSPLPEAAADPVHSGVALAAMVLRDLFVRPSPALLKARLEDALRLYKSPLIAKYALGKGADPDAHGDAFVALARAGHDALLAVMLEGGLETAKTGPGVSTIASRALYAAAGAGQQGAVALLLEKVAFTATDFEDVMGATPAIQTLLDGAKKQITATPGQAGGFDGLAAASQSFNASATKNGKTNAAPKMRPHLFPDAAKNSA